MCSVEPRSPAERVAALAEKVGLAENRAKHGSTMLHGNPWLMLGRGKSPSDSHGFLICPLGVEMARDSFRTTPSCGGFSASALTKASLSAHLPGWSLSEMIWG